MLMPEPWRVRKAERGDLFCGKRRVLCLLASEENPGPGVISLLCITSFKGFSTLGKKMYVWMKVEAAAVT